MTSNITKLWLRLPQQGKRALTKGQLEIAHTLNKMLQDTVDEKVRRFNYWITENIRLISALEELYPAANGNTND